jgi:hypothetical protein
VGGGIGREEDCTTGAVIGEVSLVPEWEGHHGEGGGGDRGI